jgi:hypothetical protein
MQILVLRVTKVTRVLSALMATAVKKVILV